MDVTDDVSGSDVAVIEFQLTYESNKPEPEELEMIQVCHSTSATEATATVGPVTPGEYCEDIDVFINQAWTLRGFMDISISPLELEESYAGKDYIELAFAGAVNFKALYYPFSDMDYEEIGENVYRQG